MPPYTIVDQLHVGTDGERAVLKAIDCASATRVALKRAKLDANRSTPSYVQEEVNLLESLRRKLLCVFVYLLDSSSCSRPVPPAPSDPRA